MKKLWCSIRAHMLLLLSAGVWVGCDQQATAPSYYSFYYFPALNTYYDVAKGAFVYTIDGGQHWYHKKAAPDELPRSLGNRFVIQSPEAEVWKHNGEHRAKYGGVTANYLDLDKQSNEVLQNVVAVSIAPVPDTALLNVDTSSIKSVRDSQKLELKKENNKEKNSGSKFFQKIKSGFRQFKEDIRGFGDRKKKE